MRFIYYTLGDDTNGGPQLPPEKYGEMQALVEEAKAAGVLVMNGGLAPSATGTALTNDDGVIRITDGPFAEAKELVGGFAIIEVASKEEALEWTKRFLTVVGSGELRVRQVYG